MRIKCAGQHIMVILNGKKVTEMDMSKWTSGTKEPGWKRYPKLAAQTFRRITDKRIYRITRKTWGFINLVP